MKHPARPNGLKQKNITFILRFFLMHPFIDVVLY